MYIAMNRFKIVLGKENDFENVWKNRETHLDKVPGFKKFNLIKGEKKENYTLYASHSVWNSKEDFVNWTKSEAFRKLIKVLVNMEIYIWDILNLKVLKR